MISFELKQQINYFLYKWKGIRLSDSVKELAGGKINNVLQLQFERPPYSAVVKINNNSRPVDIKDEFNNLVYLKEQTFFPVPEPYYFAEDKENKKSCYFMEYFNGPYLRQAPLTEIDKNRIDIEIAENLIELHNHKRELFGGIFGNTTQFWHEEFYKRADQYYKKIEGKVSSHVYKRIGEIMNRFAQIFTGAGMPSLVHGDIWTANIIVNEGKNGWYLKGFVDAGPTFSDPEYEIAYMELFGHFGNSFFETYYKTIPKRKGYNFRKLVYWLNTMIIHVYYFGGEYVGKAEKLTEQITEILSENI